MLVETVEEYFKDDIEYICITNLFTNTMSVTPTNNEDSLIMLSCDGGLKIEFTTFQIFER